MTAADLAALLAEVLPREGLSAEELQATLYDDPGGEVLWRDGGAVGVAMRDGVAWITVLAVPLASQRAGLGRSLLSDAEGWARARGAPDIRTGA